MSQRSPSSQADGSPSRNNASEQPSSSTKAKERKLSPSETPGATRRTPGADANPPLGSFTGGQLSPGVVDRVYPVRSVVSVDPTPTPYHRADAQDGYFHNTGRPSDPRRRSLSSSDASHGVTAPGRSRHVSAESNMSEANLGRTERESRSALNKDRGDSMPRLPRQVFSDIMSGKSVESEASSGNTSILPPHGPPSTKVQSSVTSDNNTEELGGLVTARFKHVITEGGHAVVTGRDGETLQRCEDEPIHIPGAIQSFGFLIALQEDTENGNLVVRIVSENCKPFIGRSPRELFALENFCDILSDEQAENLLDHIDFIRDDDADVAMNGPEVFTISFRIPGGKSRKFWCAIHVNESNPGFIICEFELEDDQENPLSPPSDSTPELPEDTLNSNPTAEEYAESTESISRPLRILRSARKRKGEAAAMEVFSIVSQVQEQLAAAPNLEKFLKVLVGMVKELSGFSRAMIYMFDSQYNGRVVAEVVDPRATKDLYKGLNFPASDIPKQARDLYRINRVRLLYDRDQTTARLVCRTLKDLENPLDLTHSYLRAMSPIHLKYLRNMAVRSSMSISINAFNDLWGLISCHGYGSRGMRVSFPIRKMCRLIGDSASRNIERLSYASRLQARKLINTAPSEHNPSGYIIASSDDLLKLFDADWGLLSIRDETKILGEMEDSQEALAMLEYLRLRKVTSVTSSQDVTLDFPDLRYGPGFKVIAGMLVVPLSAGGNDFIVFFRKGQLKEVKWAGNPYEKFIKEGTEGYLEPRKSFKTWSETVVGKSREWSEEEIETAAVLCLVYGKFIEVWRQKEAALQNSQLTRLLLSNSAHEVRTPLNHIINYLEIALEGTLDQSTRDYLTMSHSASKSLVYSLNDLLDLTKTEKTGELIKGEIFNIKTCLRETTDMFAKDAQRKGISYEVLESPGVPTKVIGDKRKVSQALSNILANAIQNTAQGGVRVEMYVANQESGHCDVEIAVEDTGVGMSSRQLDSLFRDFEQVTPESTTLLGESLAPDSKALVDKKDEKRILGLGLAVVARIICNMNGQLRLKSEEGRGSRFVILLPFDLPDTGSREESSNVTAQSSPKPQSEAKAEGEVTLVERHTSRGDSENGGIVRKNSADSINSRKSLRSFGSHASNHSGRSDIDRLIETFQAPVAEGRPGVAERSNSTSYPDSRPRLEKRPSLSESLPTSPRRARGRSLGTSSLEVPPPHRRSVQCGNVPGESPLPFSIAPVKALKVPEDSGSPIGEPRPSTSGVVGEVQETPEKTMESMTADHLNVLVAEDDPVNSRIVAKRLEKLGHEIQLTVNGEECATAYCEKPGAFDVVLMDMQMPIVDGLTSTKMIRSYEKSHPTRLLSTRASLNGRVPIIAVSASLLEKNRQSYIDAGFDGWILKPISFPRLSEILTGIVNRELREEALYKPGNWEKGGWFARAQPSVYKADTVPSEESPTGANRSVSLAVKKTSVSDRSLFETGGQGPQQAEVAEENHVFGSNTSISSS